MATSTQLGTVTFASKASDYRYIRHSQGLAYMPDGNYRHDPSDPEISYQWQHGLLTLHRGQDMLADGVDPQTGETVEQDAIDYLLSRPESGVWYVAMDEVVPDGSPLLADIARAAAAGNVEELVRLGDAEAASYGREEILDVIRDALTSLDAPRPPKKAA